MSGQEKRRDKRKKCSYVARIRPFQEGMAASVSSRWETVTLEDLSISGMLFSCSRTFRIGEVLEFNISTTPNATPVYCIGKVIRSGKRQTSTQVEGQPPVCATAILFRTSDSGTKDAIKRIFDAVQ